MTPPDGPGTPPAPGTPPPPPYPTDPATPVSEPAAQPAPVALPPKRRNSLTLLLIGLLVGIILGGAGGYFVFNGKATSNSNQSQAKASPSAVATATPAPATEVPVQTPVTAAVGVVACPAATPTGQHQLGSPGGPGSGQSAATALDFCGGGNATIPLSTTRFLTNNNWGLGIADSCPVGSSGESGMNTVLTVSEVLPGGGLGPDTATEPGDWADSASVSMATGGSYQLRVTTVSPSCIWHVRIYPTP
jgi:hypothetical protein